MLQGVKKHWANAREPAKEIQNLPGRAGLLLLLLLAVLPPVIHMLGWTFWIDVFIRLTILAIAALSLNLILGYGGLVSFGHAAFLGLGAYAVGIPAHHATYGEFEIIATYNGFFHIVLALGASALFALLTGAVCLRTRGVYFIMITMAFGQMMFYAIVSLETYGGDDGLTIDVRSELPFLNLDSPLQLYGLCYLSLVGLIYLVWRIINSRFGMVLQGIKENEERMRALGYNTYLYKLAAYVLAGTICGFAGVLLGNFTTFISPEMMDWTRSGELMFMVILGGAAYLFGPLFGAVLFLFLEELLSSFTIYWHLPFGILLISVVLFMRGGISQFLNRGER